MTAARAASFISAMGIAAGLWTFLNSAKDDVVYLTRSLVGQVQAAHRKFDETEDKIAAGERLGGVQARFYIRYRFPEGDPDAQQMLFDGLFWHLGRCDPETAEYGADDEPRKTADGVERAHRQVVMKGRDRDDQPMTLTLEWVQFKGSWYIDDYTVE